jgi:hypothetical protein
VKDDARGLELEVERPGVVKCDWRSKQILPVSRLWIDDRCRHAAEIQSCSMPCHLTIGKRVPRGFSGAIPGPSLHGKFFRPAAPRAAIT